MSHSPETLPDLSSEYPISAEQTAAYRRDGHILLRRVCTPEELAVYRPLLTETTLRHSRETRKLEDRDTYGKAFLQIGNLWQKQEALRPFVMARRFAKIAADLMGVEGIRLYHDQALYKEVGGGPTPWHQDQYYWPLDTQNSVTMWMPLVDIAVEMGALTFASGSHKFGLLSHTAISDDSQEIYNQYVREQGFPVVNQAMRAGDATFHSGWLAHCAPGNSGDRMREVMTIIHYEDGVKVMTDLGNSARKADLDGIMPGVKPGEPAVSELTPLLYRR